MNREREDLLKGIMDSTEKKLNDREKRGSWKGESLTTLRAWFRNEVEEFKIAMWRMEAGHGDLDNVRDELADVCITAGFLADHFGALGEMEGTEAIVFENMRLRGEVDLLRREVMIRESFRGVFWRKFRRFMGVVRP